MNIARGLLAAAGVAPAALVLLCLAPGAFLAVRGPQHDPATHNPSALFGLPFEEVRHGRVRGWLVPGPRPAPDDGSPPLGVVLVHGAGRNRGQLLSYVPFLWREARATVLLIDCVGAAARVPMGYDEHDEVLDAAAYLRGRLPPGREGRVVVLGTSAGGSATIRAAGIDTRREAPGRHVMDAVVSVAAFSSLHGVLRDDIPPNVVDRFPFIVGRAARRLLPLARPLVAWAAGETEDDTPLAAVRVGLAQPLFIVHGSHDGMVHVDLSHELRDASRGPVEHHVVHHGSHNPTHLLTACASFRNKLLAFLERARASPRV